ncbi:hypothetical protein OEZ85_007472 [Tetradesmus obliquus]|uniref:Secreted protein n=1 Tax=Tetradesmus obliquus TaxID=3088 RepID=A0ABY8TI63_TETOB|nr:hypothetical protein OEZ85_007472 [Tetradesmus obliquus]
MNVLWVFRNNRRLVIRWLVCIGGDSGPQLPTSTIVRCYRDATTKHTRTHPSLSLYSQGGHGCPASAP